MLKKLVILSLAIFSSCVTAKTIDRAPDCSADSDARINTALTSSFESKGLKKYIDSFLGTSPKDKATYKVEILSSEEINTQEKQRLMLRLAKRDGIKDSEIKSSGLQSMYMGQPLYRQYYKVTSSKGFKAIAEFYSAVGVCAVDLENIYIISDQIDGSTPDFADK